jgi:type IV pilus assembly protein PilM
LRVTVQDLIKGVTRFLEGGALDSPRQPRYPDAAIEITPDRVIGVRLSQDRKTGRTDLQRVDSEPLPEGAIESSLVKPNILIPEPVSLAIRSVLSRVAHGDHRVSLIIPDHVARVAIFGFTSVPHTRRELADLVRFRMAKSLPFKSEDAVMDVTVLGRGAGAGPTPSGVSILAAFIKRTVLEQYEALVLKAGYWPGLVGLSTLELYNLFRARIAGERGDEKDMLLMNLTRHDLTLLIFRGEELIFYRCKPHPPGSGGEEKIAALRREVYTSFAFYQEKLLGRGIGRAYLRSVGVPQEAVREVVARETGCQLESLDLLQRLSVAEGLEIEPFTATEASAAVGAVAGRRS